ncbi:MAG: acylphosphatase [Candidatus Levybacteria bacterium]|nr:acylphosphatase [Candidatus Levybacteria bacterium]MDZ4227637.1 acylphosphatase [Candidatus Levybacteria bacterium]
MTAHVFISGFVQGVGYRRFAKRSAKQIGLTGWVKNLSDNRVEAIFQGSKERIDKILFVCEKGPFLSEVKDVAVEWEGQSIEAFSSFEILH